MRLLVKPFLETWYVKGEKVRFCGLQAEAIKNFQLQRRPLLKVGRIVTTIFEASEAVRRFVKLTDWCLVVVFDKKTPQTYDTKWTQGEGNEIVVLLYPDTQEAMKNQFVGSLPWNTFGRKNVGCNNAWS